jgi:hypothetical protein
MKNIGAVVRVQFHKSQQRRVKILMEYLLKNLSVRIVMQMNKRKKRKVLTYKTVRNPQVMRAVSGMKKKKNKKENKKEKKKKKKLAVESLNQKK